MHGSWRLGNSIAMSPALVGLRTRLPEAQQALLWSIFERVRKALKERKLTTHAEIFTLLALALAKGNHPPFDFAVVDEAQGVSGAPAAEFLDDLMNRGGV